MGVLQPSHTCMHVNMTEIVIACVELDDKEIHTEVVARSGISQGFCAIIVSNPPPPPLPIIVKSL